MKKIYLTFILILCIFISGCSNTSKEVITNETFANNATSNNFTYEDNLTSYSNYNYILSAYIAKYNEDISIEFITYDTEDNAKKVQESQIKGFNTLKSTGAAETKDKGKNYYKYILISNNYYMISSRIDNTLVFCKTPLTNKDTVEKLITSIGY